MFKFLNIILLAGFAATNAYAADYNEENIVFEESIDYDYNEESVASSMNSNVEDSYESNDNLDTATCLSPSNYYSVNVYNASVSATLDTYSMIIDHDYYYFTLLTDSYVSIDTTVYSIYGCDYDFLVMGYEYEYNEVTSTAYRDLIEIYSNCTNDQEKFYSNIFKAGTYFIYLRGQQEYNSGICIDYHLDLYVEKTADSPSVTISSMLNSEYVGAVWISDFVPMQYGPSFDITKEITYYQYNQNGINTPDYALNSLKSIANENAINVATYYLWDPVVKHLLHQLMTVMSENYFIVANEINNTITKYELIHDAVENTISIICNIAGVVVEVGWISVALDVFEFVSLTSLEYIFNAITPKVTYNNLCISNMLGKYVEILEIKPDKMVYDNYDYFLDYEYIQNNFRKSIVYLPFFYNFDESESLLPVNKKHFISFLATATEVANISSFRIVDDITIHSNPYNYSSNIADYPNDNDTIVLKFLEHNFYCRGKIYGLTDFDDLFDITALSLYDENYVRPHQHEYIYTWVNKRQHSISCSCGLPFGTEPHAISSNTGLCIRCGGTGMGFIDIMSINENQNYVLDENIIIPNDLDVIAILSGEIKNKEDDE